MINTVTMTGADDSVQPEQLFDISQKYPFVEWGILISKSSHGQRRFPTMGWLSRLYDLNTMHPGVLRLSAHLCGAYVRNVTVGGVDFLTDLKHLFGMFHRVQINFHGQEHTNSYLMAEALGIFPNREWIFQYDNVNTALLYAALKRGVNASALYDLSHGAGILPEQWPTPLSGVKCGYAGGIGPENISEQITAINYLTKDKDAWIDMETKIRSDNDSKFDLLKVVDCLDIGQKQITKAMEINNFTLPYMKKFKVIAKDPTHNDKKFERYFMAKDHEMVEAEANILFGTSNVIDIVEEDGF